MAQRYNWSVEVEGPDSELFEVVVVYSISKPRAATFTDPPEDSEVELLEFAVDGYDYEPTEEQEQAWSDTIAQEHDFTDYGDR